MSDKYTPSIDDLQQLNSQIAFKWLVKEICDKMDDIQRQCMYAKDMEELTGMKESFKQLQWILAKLNLKYKDNVKEVNYPIGF
jgi:cell fate (sporulation/competence/biofilm development) regulator YmcA (YheA/YmcA/DUF963 family)